MAMFHLLKIRTSKDIFSIEKCKITFGIKYITCINGTDKNKVYYMRRTKIGY